MNVDIAIVFGSNCYDPGGFLTLRDPNVKVFDDIVISNIKYERFSDPARNLYFLLGGSSYIRYGSSIPYPLNSPNNETEWAPISAPYTSSEWADYVNNWNYSEDFCMRLTESMVFASIYFKDPPSENLAVKVGVFSNTATKSITANSSLIIVKKDGTPCDINGESMALNATSISYPVVSDQDVTVTVPDTFYMIYLQNV